MAGTIVADTIQDGAGNSTAMDNAIYGSAKAWVNFNGGNGNTAGVINASYNVSSITVNGTGDYTVNFTNAFSDAKYAPMTNLLNSSGNRACSVYASGTTSVSIYAYACTSGANNNMSNIYAAIFR